jgi:hypothetical protein
MVIATAIVLLRFDRLGAIPYLATAQRTPTWLARHGITINVANLREMPLVT